MRAAYSLVLSGTVLAVTLFGLPTLLSRADHHVGCPLAIMRAAPCESTIIEHVSMWDSLFAASIVSLALVFTFVAFVSIKSGAILLTHERLRLRSSALASERPTILQELYSQGIHNRKAP
jgi:hypothetical protein